MLNRRMKVWLFKKVCHISGCSDLVRNKVISTAGSTTRQVAIFLQIYGGPESTAVDRVSTMLLHLWCLHRALMCMITFARTDWTVQRRQLPFHLTYATSFNTCQGSAKTAHPFLCVKQNSLLLPMTNKTLNIVSLSATIALHVHRKTSL